MTRAKAHRTEVDWEERRVGVIDQYKPIAESLGKPMSVFELTAAVSHDERTDLEGLPTDCWGAAYDRRGLLNLVSVLLERLAANG